MKIFILSLLLVISTVSFSEEEDSEIEKQVTSSSHDKMTVREAKALCKKEDKKGKELVLCIKEKMKK